MQLEKLFILFQFLQINSQVHHYYSKKEALLHILYIKINFMIKMTLMTLLVYK